MDDEELPNLIKNIKRNRSKTKLFHYLKILRRLVDDKSKFTSVRESGGLRLILTYLPKNSLEIVDIILSIIGNCCMDRECSKEVVKYNGLSVLCDILEKANQDSVICRVLRILGNIAQFDNFASEIYKYNVVPVIVKLLNRSNDTNDGDSKEKKDGKPLSMDSEGMAVRALRILWQSYSNRQNMINDDVIRAVSMILIRNTQIWQKKDNPEHVRRRSEKLLENVLKCLLLFSKWSTFICAEQMLANGLGFKSLVILVDLFPYSAIKCLTNLSPVAKSRADIDISAAVKSIIEKIKFHFKKKTSRGCPNEIINAFCLFSRHPLNCCEVKRAGGLPVILEVLKNCRSRKQEFQIIHALPAFFNDEESQEILVTNGIVKILIDCLERNLKSKSPLNESHVYIRCKKSRRSVKKKEKCLSPSLNINSGNCSEPRPSSPTLDDFYNKMGLLSGKHILNQCLTPSDSESSVLSSPCASPSRQPDNDDDDDSVNYSPVCSETEDMEIMQDIPSTLTPNLSPQIFEESDDDNCESEQKHFESSDTQEKSVIIMLIVLYRTLHIKPYPIELHATRTIETLLKYLRESKYPQGRVTDLLTQICSNVDNLMPLILNGSIYTIHSLTQIQHDNTCAKCIRMRDVGNELIDKLYDVTTSDKAKTFLCEKMNCDNENKRNCVIITPFIVKTKSLLRYIMDTSGGLNLLITQYKTNITDRTKILTALNKLACRININNPCLETSHSNRKLKIPENFTAKKNYDNKKLTIKLDDGQEIITDREFLIEKVDYFKAMLNGSFKEADQDCIRLRNVSRNALNFLLYLLILNRQVEPLFLDVDLTTVLEVIKLTDSYLLENLTEWLTSCVECYMINKTSASQIYKWSVESGTNFLRVETIAYLLTGKMYDVERYKLCENILDYGLSEQLLNDFRQLIERYLKIR